MIAGAMNLAGASHPAVEMHVPLTWQWSAFPVTVLFLCVFCAIWYLRATWYLRLRGRSWSIARTLSFLAGLLAVDVAVQSPVAPDTMLQFQAHIVQHLLLMVVAPPLLALAAPSTLLLQTASRSTKVRWLRILRSPWFAALTHPAVAFFLYFGIMTIFFLTSLINVAMNHMALMDVMNALFLLGATIYWWPMIGLDPVVHWKLSYASRMLNILLGSAVEAFLGVAILAKTQPIATMYTVAGTRAGGALLWVSTEFVTVGVFLPIFIQWYRSERRVEARSDQDVRRRHATATADEAPASRALTPWELEWIARTGKAPAELRLGPEHLEPRDVEGAVG